MAGSHEVRGSIPLGSTTDTRGPAGDGGPLFFASRDGKEGPRGAIVLGRCGRLACSRPPFLEPVKRYEHLTGLCFLLGGFSGYVSCAVSYERIHYGVISSIPFPGKS